MSRDLTLLDHMVDQAVGEAQTADFQAAEDRRREAAAVEGPSAGRPKGSRNRRTQQLAKLIDSQCGNPVMAMARIYAMPVEALAKRLGCKLLEAAELQLKAANQVAPYTDQKQPTAIEAPAGAVLPLVVMGDVARAEDGQVDVEALMAAPIEVIPHNVSDQPLIDADQAATDGEATDEDA